jgi:AcrR family transcriptional regulator
MRIKGLNGELIKQYIAESLLILMASKPYDKITIAQITDKAGVNRSSYYRHFETKEDIIRFYLMSIMHEYMDKYHKQGNPGFSAYILQMFRTFSEHQKDLMRIHQNGLSYLLLDVLNTCFRFDEMATSAARSRQYEAAYHIGGIYNDLLLWMNHQMAETPEEMTEIVLAFHPKGTFTLLNAH